eukprot:8474300-Pyramimonas_sp.AAC.1
MRGWYASPSGYSGEGLGKGIRASRSKGGQRDAVERWTSVDALCMAHRALHIPEQSSRAVVACVRCACAARDVEQEPRRAKGAPYVSRPRSQAAVPVVLSHLCARGGVLPLHAPLQRKTTQCAAP